MPYYRCEECALVFAHPREWCTTCGSDAIARQWSTGEGVVYSFTTLHRAGHPWFADAVSYTIALVEFPEGFRALADLTMSSYADEPYVGQRVRVEFEEVTEEITLAHFVVQDKA